MSTVATASIVLTAVMPQVIQTTPQPDGSIYVLTNYMTNVPAQCQPVKVDEGYTAMICPPGRVYDSGATLE